MSVPGVQFNGQGIVQEIRELKDKAQQVWKRLLKLSVMGGTAEIGLPLDRTFPAATNGASVVVIGKLVPNYKGIMELVADKVDVAK